MNRTHVVYRALDASGHLLWIGQTYRPRRRLQDHSKEAEWWPLMAQVTYTRRTTRRAAVRYERIAIRSEQPIYNIAHKGDFHGTMTRYSHGGCRCEPCRAVRRRYLARRSLELAEALRRDPSLAEHGRISTYKEWRCRCSECRAANTAVERRRRERYKRPALDEWAAQRQAS